MKIHLIFSTFILFYSSAVYAQQEKILKSFQHLKSIKVSGYEERVTVLLELSSSKIYNSTFQEINDKPKGFLLDDIECEINGVVIAEVLLDKKTDKRCLLTFGICPEFEFFLYDLETKEMIDSFFATEIVISGNGSVYTSGHLLDYNLRKKYQFDGRTFKEVNQPFYYIGLKSYTLRQVELFSDIELTQKLATLPKHYDVEVLLASNDKRFPSNYLVKTSYGLVGWAHLKSGQYQSIDIEGLFYNND